MQNVDLERVMRKTNGTKAQRRAMARMANQAKERSDVLMETYDEDCGQYDVWYWGFDEVTGTIFAGGATNSGVVREVEVLYDHDRTFQDNLSELCDMVNRHVEGMR